MTFQNEHWQHHRKVAIHVQNTELLHPADGQMMGYRFVIKLYAETALITIT